MRSLTEHLQHKQPHQLTALAHYWQIDLPTTPYWGGPNYAHLAQEMQSEYLQRRVVEKLTPPQRQILHYFIIQPEYRIEPGALNLPKLGPKQLAEELAFLKEVGLIYLEEIPLLPSETEKAQAKSKASRRYFQASQVRYKTVVVLPSELARLLSPVLLEWEESLASGGGALRQARGQARGSQPLAHLLTELTPKVFKARVREMGLVGLLAVGGKDHPKGPPIFTPERVAQLLADAYHQRQILLEVEEVSRQLFERLKKAGGRVETASLLKEYQGVKGLGQALRPLKERLLAWEEFEGGQGVVFLPAELVHPTTDSTPPPLALQEVEAPTKVTTYPPYALAWDTLSFLSYLAQNRVELTNQGTIPVRDQKKIASQLWETPDPKDKAKEALALARYTFLVEICQRLKLYEKRYQENDRLVVGPKLEEWLSLDLYEQARLLARCWLAEGSKVGAMVGGYPSYYYYSRGNRVERANRAMLSWLLWGEAGEWYSFSSLLEKVRQEEPYFVVSRQELLKMSGQQPLLTHLEQWPVVEGALIEKSYRTFLEWLGLVKLGRDERGQVVAFSLTELGLELAGANGGKAVAKVSLPPVDKPLLVQPNFEVMVFVPQAATLWQLMKFANQRKLDQVSLYFLSRDSILRGLENGLGLEEMLLWLGSHSAQPLPQNLAVSVKDWSKAFKEVEVEQVMLLEVADEAVLDELLANKQFAAAFVRRLSATAAIVTLPDTVENRRTNPLKTFKSKLKSGGYFPK